MIPAAVLASLLAASAALAWSLTRKPRRGPFTVLAEWYLSRRCARNTTGKPRDGQPLTEDEDHELSQMALLHYLTAHDPQKAPRGKRR